MLVASKSTYGRGGNVSVESSLGELFFSVLPHIGASVFFTVYLYMCCMFYECSI